MTYPCRVPGCGRPAASRFAAYCSPHKANLRRHGAANQRSITKTVLKPYEKFVRDRIEKYSSSPAWPTLDARWLALVEHARRIVAEAERGRPGTRFERAAAYEVVKLAREVKPREVVEVTAAMVMMQELDPRQFRSDQAFWVQLARRARGLTDVNFGERWDNTRGKVRRCYRDLTPRAAVILGRWLAEALGIGGQHLARLQQAEWEKKANETRDLRDALSKLV